MKTRLFLFVQCIMVFFVFSLHAQQQFPDVSGQKPKSHSAHDTTRLRILLELASASLSTNPKAAIEYCDEAVSLGEKLEIKKSIIRALDIQGQAFFSLGNIPKFEKAFEDAIILANEINDSDEIARIYNNFGTLLLNSGNPTKALPLFLKALSINQAMGRQDWIAHHQDNLGMTYCLLADYDKALSCHLKALAFFEESGKEYKSANCCTNIGNVFNYIDEEEKAREYYEKALPYYQKTNDRHGIAMISLNIGLTYGDLPDKRLYFKYILDAYEINLQDSNLMELSFVQTNMAHRLNSLSDENYQMLKRNGTFRGVDDGTANQHEFALKLLNSSLDIYSNQSEWFGYNFAISLIGQTWSKLKQYDKALAFLHRSLVMADTLKNPDKHYQALALISGVYEGMGQYDSALYYFQKYVLLRDSLKNNMVLREIQRKEIQYQFEVKEKELIRQREVSDLNASLAQQHALQNFLRLKTSEQSLALRSKELELSRREEEVSHLAYLKKKAELQAVGLDKKMQAKKLALLGKEHQLARQLIRNRSLQRNISYGIILVSIIILGLIFRNFLRQRKHNRQLKKLNAEVENVNLLLQRSNRELSTTLDHLQTAQAQLIEAEKQKEKEIIRRRIAQDMHDDVSSGLSKIVWLCEMAGRKVAQAEYQTIQGTISRIADSSREAIERIGEIIWAIDPDRDNLEGFYAYLRTYIMEYFEQTNYKVKLEFPDHQDTIRFNPDVKRTIFIVIKEALHNVLKHAHGDKVKVVFSIEGPDYEITVTDNGRGLDGVDPGGKGNGLKNMKQRMQGVAGTFSIIPNGGKGACIRLAGPMTGV